MSKGFKSAASSSRVAPSGAGFGGFGATSSASQLSYLAEIPDLTSISDPNLVVAFKSLRKPDTTTKLRSLSTITSYVEAHAELANGGVEDSILEAWVHFYPRLSIANDRRVREASHSLQAALLKAAGKRMLKYIPKTIGAWLAGCFDKEIIVSRVAQTGLESFLDTNEKVTQFWRRGQSQILDYARDALQETPATLSDERNTAEDDSMEVFHRVKSSSLSLVTNLLLKLKSEDIATCQGKYEDYFNEGKALWYSGTSTDASVRRAACHLLIACLDRRPSIVSTHLDWISTGYIAFSLRESQTMTAMLLLQALEKLTIEHPEAWDGPYKVSKLNFPTSFEILSRFVKKGSQNCSSKYWLSLQSLFQRLPPRILPSTTESCLDFLVLLKKVISGEPKQHVEQAWSSYFDIASSTIKNLQAPMKDAVVKSGIVSLFGDYLSGQDNLIPSTALAESYYMLVLSSQLGNSEDCLLKCLRIFADNLILHIRQSAEVNTTVEKPDDYTETQRVVIQMGHRWFSLLADIFALNESEKYTSWMAVPSRQILNAATETISADNGQAYSAAAIVEIVLRLTPKLVDDESEGLLKSLVEVQIPRLILSQSSRHLSSLLSIFGSLPDHISVFEKGWQTTVDRLISSAPQSSTFDILNGLMKNKSATRLAQENAGLQTLLVDAATRSLEGELKARSLVETAIRFDSLSLAGAGTMIDELLKYLNPKSYDIHSSHSQVALATLELISQERSEYLYRSQATAIEVIRSLLGLIESSDGQLAARARKLRFDLRTSSHDLFTNGTNGNPILDLIQRNLEMELSSPELLLIETLVLEAQSARHNFPGSVSAPNFFPNPEIWFGALRVPLSTPPNPALGVMRPMAGAAFLVPLPSIVAKQAAPQGLPFSVAVRMALYTSKMVEDIDLVKALPTEILLELLHCLVLTVELVSERIDLLPDGEMPEGFVDYEATSDLVFSGYLFPQIIEAHIYHNEETEDRLSQVARLLCSKLIETTRSAYSIAYYAAKAINHLLTRIVDAHGCSIVECDHWLTDTNVVSLAPRDIFANIGMLSGLGTALAKSKIANTLCNKLVSAIADAKPQSEKTLGSLVLLNAALAVYDEDEDEIPVASNRLVFAVRQILSWSEELPKANTRLAAEACHSLQRLLPAIKEVYGTYWETALDLCISIWSSTVDELSDDIVPMVGMSLKLYQVLRKIQDPNDDLQETLADHSEQISDGLIHLLKLQRSMEHKPLDFVDTLLLREMRDMPLQHVEDQSDFYLILSSDNRKLQSAAFQVLHSTIPSTQQQISVDVLLEKKDARLPDELMSLLLNSPSYESYSDAQLQVFPVPIRCYLLSWYLVYYSFSSASNKVQNDYAENLKSEKVIDPLLQFLFDVLGHTSGKPLDLERRGLASISWEYDLWDPVVDTDPERDMQRLLVNIWFMCLKHTPDLAKTWFLAVKSKQTSLAVTSWTEKYFSPSLISEAKQVATQWAEDQETSDDEKKLLVKVSKNSPSIAVGYEIDEMMMAITMTLPNTYPLDRVDVKGVNRVAVKESTWNGWMRTIQGAIMFNNGTIADGLSVFKRNILAALKGQTECSICYSIISSDKRIPDKRCQTCKNLFHAGCLFKWFASSNASTCPMCRQPFNYGAAPRGGRTDVVA